jgi:hypothetical protein
VLRLINLYSYIRRVSSSSSVSSVMRLPCFSSASGSSISSTSNEVECFRAFETAKLMSDGASMNVSLRLLRENASAKNRIADGGEEVKRCLGGLNWSEC